jgi:hypothetical protein
MLYGQAKPIMSIEDLIAQMQQQGQQPQAAPAPAGIGALPEQAPVAPDLPMVGGYAESEDIGRDIYSEQNPEPEKKLGLFGRIRQQPGGSKALLAMGASLLSDPDFFSGFGKGALAYQNVLDEEKEKLKPKTEYLAQGAFQMTYDPVTGKRVIERTPVADFEEGNLKTKLQTQLEIGKNRNATTLEANNQDNETNLKIAINRIDAERELAIANREWDKVKFYDELENKLEVARIGASGKEGKPPPASVIKIKNEIQSNALFADQATRRMDNVINNIDSGNLELGLFRNNVNKLGLVAGFDALGQNDEYQDFETTLQFIRNAKLRLNVGVQTTFDAQVAMLEVALGKGDANAVKSAFAELKRTFAESNALNESQLEEIESYYPSGGSSRSTPSRKTQSIREKYGLE